MCFTPPPCFLVLFCDDPDRHPSWIGRVHNGVDTPPRARRRKLVAQLLTQLPTQMETYLDFGTVLRFTAILAIVEATASPSAAPTPNPQTCAEAQAQGAAVDGNYYLELEGQLVQVFCYKMGPNINESGAPFAYINLDSAAPNIAQWVRDCGTTTTVFSKLRLNESTMRVETSDCK